VTIKNGRSGKAAKMTNSEGLAIAYGLASAASWGTGDFSGGLAAKRTSVYSVIILSQLVGGIFLITLAVLIKESLPAPEGLFLGSAAGLCGVFGLVALYRGLARGQMGLVAPVAAVVTAILPIIAGILNEGLPSALQLLGFGLALVAVWFLAGLGRGASRQWRVLGLPVAAGIGFGVFFILINQVSDEAILWPLAAARVASVLALSIFIIGRQRGGLPTSRGQFLVIALAGIFDSGGNAFFALATRAGRLDIAAVLGSLYPAATVLLAWLILKERLGRQQWLGILMALAALAFIAL
jgi:drug/metabolite transporter (DMT)-like permease